MTKICNLKKMKIGNLGWAQCHVYLYYVEQAGSIPPQNMRSAVQVETGSTGPVLERNQCSSPLIQFTRQLTAVDVHHRWKFQHQKGNLEMTACPT
jgi:hypothetical protein